ncbi:MAG: pyruvate kinase [Tepidanaerobacteraceae bacterium]|jgi:pyruvate kinase|nr:pyruvate kinase [Thermoanaerobacterales bacterium]
MLRTKIICTLGPSSDDKKIIAQMIQSGMSIARINLSHGNHEEHSKRVKVLREACRELKTDVALLLDTKGPEIRLGTFNGGKAVLKKGQEFILNAEPMVGSEKEAYVNYCGICKDVSPGDTILLADGLIELQVKKTQENKVICDVLNSGELRDRQGVNIPDKSLALPALAEKDIEDIIFGINIDADFIAASFIRKAADVKEIRKILEEHKGTGIHIIAKIENREGIQNIDEIISVSDGIMIARGDLGVEIPVQEIPLIQKMIIEKCNVAGKPVITATQMLDSMIRNPRPTRAETTDVANAIFDGSDAIMLSGETAAGKYPVEAVKMMASIAEKADKALLKNQHQKIIDVKSVTDAISHATCSMALELGAKAIITSTKSGYTAKAVAKFRPKVPIIAVTFIDKVIKTLQIVYGVKPLKVKKTLSTDEMFIEAINGALNSGMVEKGDLVIITAGVPVNITGNTNLIRVYVVGEGY